MQLAELIARGKDSVKNTVNLLVIDDKDTTHAGRAALINPKVK